MSLIAIGSALSLLAAAGSAPIVSEVDMFERVAIDSDLEFYTIGVFDDTRCPDRELCNQEEKLVVAAVVIDGRRRTGVTLQMGIPLRIAGGTLTLVSTSAKPRLYGAIPLREYGLTYVFERDRES
ncbi:MAG: hypothetical protein ACO25F_11120 [Erythrobacter sp.]